MIYGSVSGPGVSSLFAEVMIITTLRLYYNGNGDLFKDKYDTELT